jgi:predicted O-methyltransferase YrrM
MTTYSVDLSQYIADIFARHDPGLERAFKDTPKRGLPAINIRPEEGRFLQFLVRTCGAKNAVEVGTLGGYSGIWIARGLLPGGKLFTLEKDPHHAQVAREHFAAAGVDDKVEVLVGNGHQLLKELAPQGPFDFLFIDAEKSGYDQYFDWGLEHIRTGGVIAAHNAFRGGRVLDPAGSDASVALVDELNRRAARHPDLIATIFPAGDGTLIAVKTG